VVSFMPHLLYSQGKNPWYLLDMRLGGPQSWSGHGGEEKNSQPTAKCYATELFQPLPCDI